MSLSDTSRMEYAGTMSNHVFSCILGFLMQFQRAPDNSKLFPGPSLCQAYSKPIPSYFQLIPAYSSLCPAHSKPIPSVFQVTSSLFRAIPCVFQAIPHVFQAIPALLQASPSISTTFAQEIFGSHFSCLRFRASHVGGYCGAQNM